MVQLAPLQPAVAWAKLHGVPHAPQLLTSLAVLTSHPVEASLSQSA
jgi:hypothetical protein